MKKIIKIIGVLLVIVLVGGYFYIQQLKPALPNYNEKIQIAGLLNQVTVYRDAYGVPHIVAQNEHDLYTVVGYLSAQDRLWQMDLLRRVTQGRLSEILNEDFVDTDVLLRKLRLPENSKKLLPTLDKKISAPLQYFANGVNQYMSDHKDNLPFEFQLLGYTPEQWQPEHSLNLVGFMAWNLELGYKMEATLHVLSDKLNQQQIKELLPDYKSMNTEAYPSYKLPQKVIIDTALVASINQIGQVTPDIFTGSNNWVVSGKKSTTGKPIFSNDMHLGLDIPGIWTRMHLTIPNKLNVTGVLLPGEPYVVAGHNNKIAWGMTNVMLDGADFYMERINPNNKLQYRLNGTWKDLEVHHEKIYIRGKKEPVEKTLYFTHRGPIFTSFDDVSVNPVSMHWIGNEESREIEALYKLSTAQNWTEFCTAIQGFQSVSQNIAYADIDGNIGLHMTGRLPIRTAPGYLFLPGDTDKYDWKGYVPFDSLPFEYNPSRGYVSSANNKSVYDAYPHYISEWYDVPYRIKRIRQMIDAKDKLSTEDIRQMLYDHHAVQADEIKPVLLKHLEQENDLSETEKKAVTLLKKWNNTYEIDLPQPVIFDQTLINLVRKLTHDEMGDEVFAMYNRSMLFSKYLIYNSFKQNNTVWADDINTRQKETFHEIIVKTFKETVKQLHNEYGAIDQIAWGDVHKLELEHPLGKKKILDVIFDLNRSYDAPGNANTVNPFSYEQYSPYGARFGASEKHIFNTSDWDKSYSILPTGVSGNPESEFYCNQSENYVKGKLLPDYFTEKEVKDHAKYTAVFSGK